MLRFFLGSKKVLFSGHFSLEWFFKTFKVIAFKKLKKKKKIKSEICSIKLLQLFISKFKKGTKPQFGAVNGSQVPPF